MIEEILCEARERKRSLLGVNEHFVIRSIVQNLPIRTIFNTDYLFNLKINLRTLPTPNIGA